MQESGCKLDHPSATRFQTHVIEGKWDDVRIYIFHLGISNTILPLLQAETDLSDLQILLGDKAALLVSIIT